MGIISLVIGIITVILSLTWYAPIVCTVIGIVGVILGRVAAIDYKVCAKAGVVVSVIGIVCALLHYAQWTDYEVFCIKFKLLFGWY